MEETRKRVGIDTYARIDEAVGLQGITKEFWNKLQNNHTMAVIINKDSWFIKDEDGDTLAYKLPSYKPGIIHKEESLRQLSYAISDLIDEQQRKLKELLDINSILQSHKTEE